MFSSLPTQNPRQLCLQILLVICFLFSGTSAIADNRALLVGVGHYEMGIKLPGIEKDIQNMKKAVSLMGFKENQVKVLFNNHASLDGIQQAIQEWLVKGVTSNDRVLFYFTGHGSQIADKNGDEADGADEVLLPFNAKIQNEILDNVLVDEEFDRILDNIPAKMVLVFLDACHSGTATRKVLTGEDDLIPKFFDYKGMPITRKNPEKETTVDNKKYIALSACKDDEEALSSKKGSLLTQGVLNALNEASLLGRGLTMDEFKTKTTDFISRNLALSSRTQHPQITGNKNLASTYIIDIHQEILWKRLKKLSSDPAQKINISAQKRLIINDTIVISCKTDRSGYLNIIYINADEKEAMVLFPNRFHPDNGVNTKSIILVPEKKDPFVLRAQPPSGKSMILAFSTQKAINSFTDGVGNSSDDFKKFSKKSFQEILNEKKEHPSKFGAGVVITEICEK